MSSTMCFRAYTSPPSPARPRCAHRRPYAAALGLLPLLAATAPVVGEGPINARYRDDLVKTVQQFIGRRLTDWVTYYRDLHAHPELSSHERKSAKRIADQLSTAGYTVTTGIGGFGVAGVLTNGEGPTVLIRGDMDALPVTEETGLPYASKAEAASQDGQQVGVMHACGHDVHQVCLVGTAQLLANLRDSWRGTVLIVAQPAEEIGMGARLMIEDGLFDRSVRPDYCLALHVSAERPVGTIAYTPGWAMANVDSVDITIFGRGGHGSRPHQAIDPIVAAAQVIVSLQTIVSRRVDPLEPAVITVGSIHAGSKHNIIPNEAHMQITVRSYTEATRKTLLDGIRDITIHTCRAMGCVKDPEVVVRDAEFTPATYNDPALTEAAAQVFRKVLGPEQVLRGKPVMGGEDFGRFPKHLGVPGLMFSLGSVDQARYDASRGSGGEPLPSLHSRKYAPDDERTIATGVRAMASLALALLDEER